MSPVGEIHRQDAVTGLENAEVDGHVGLASAVGLDIRMVRAEEFFGAFDGEGLDHVDMLASPVPAATRIPLGIFVGQAGSLGLHDGPAGEVLGGDQLDVFELPMMFGGDRLSDLRIGEGK